MPNAPSRAQTLAIDPGLNCPGFDGGSILWEDWLLKCGSTDRLAWRRRTLAAFPILANHLSTAGHHSQEDSEMSKKKRADIGKLVDAQAKGKKVTGSKTDKKTPEGRDLDVRTSKWIKTDFG
jgi:hypothetical protein